MTPTADTIRDDKLWRDLARPVLIRASERWTNESTVLRQIALPDMRLYAAVKCGLVERRQHRLTRRWQIRSAPIPAWQKARLAVGER